MKFDDTLRLREGLRSRWGEVRGARLALKISLQKDGIPADKIRCNREYKLLRKEQKHISRMIKHNERKIQRALIDEKHK